MVIARVAGTPISKATFDHWSKIEEILLYDQRPTKRPPSGAIADPPHYEACIAYLARNRFASVQLGAKLTAVQRRAECSKKYQQAWRTALSFLITWNWIMDEAKRQGLIAPDALVRHRFELQKRAEFPSDAEFSLHLTLTGETMSDRLLRSKVKVYSEALEHKFMSQQFTTRNRAREVERFAKEFPRRWAARTSCRAGYIVPLCREYRGPLPPEPVI